MKKVIKIFLFLFVFFVININTLAIGISKNEITNDINRNHYELVVGDYLCVYKAQDESEYVAIKFEKINSNRFNVIFYVNDEYANSYKFNDYGELPTNLKYDDGIYLTSAPNCSDYVFYYYIVEPFYTIYSITQIGGVNNIEKDDMIFDSELSELDIDANNPIISLTPATELYITINNEKYYYVEDTDYVSHFESAAGVWACYVETDPANDLSYLAKNVPLDFDFNDPDLVVQIDPSLSNPICNGGYIILEKTHANTGNGSALEGNSDITLIDKFVPYQHSNGTYIQVYSNNSGIIVQLNGNERIAVENISQYDSIYLNATIESYPKYLIYSNNNYYFSDSKDLDLNSVAFIFSADIKFHSKFSINKNLASTDIIYISLRKLYSVPNSEEATLETCQDLFNPEFLEFLNNNIFKIIYIGIPIILILLTSFDFAKVVFVDDKEGIQKAGKRFGKRVVVAILIFLVPTIIIFISNIMGADQIDTCVQYFNDMSETY